jgi:acetoin utilization protein AcuC
MMKTVLVHSEDWRRFDYGPEHPLRMERLSLTWRLMEAYGLTAGPKVKVLTPAPASVDEIARFHTREYIEILRAVSAGEWVPHAARYGLGAGDNPIFPGLWEAGELVAGGSMLAAQLVLDSEATRAFHFAGGLHHAMRDRASGFCYVNDAVLAIIELRRRDWKVAYVDIDAHHGDGVQFAFYDDPRVLTISSHERGDRLFPGTGFVEEMGEGEGVGYSVNLPLQPYTDDAVYAPAFEAVVPPLLDAFEPDVVVLQLGIDSHRTDPLTHLAWTVQGFTNIVTRLLELSPACAGPGRRGLRPAQCRAGVDGGVGCHQPRGAGRGDPARLPQGARRPRAQEHAAVGCPPRATRGHAAVGRGLCHAAGPPHPRAHLPIHGL